MIRQQRKADFAWTLCRARDLPGKHNILLHTVMQEAGAFEFWIVLEKIQSKTHISLAYPEKSMYTLTCCGMIAMKREVAARCGRFFRGANVKLGNWRQVTVQL